MPPPRLCLLVLPALLVACGGQASRLPEATARSAETSKTSGKMARKSSVVQKRGGAYYNDGPGDEIPDNLDDIPDAQPRLEPLHRFANRPYVVLGKAYEPHASLRAHQERGVASWYGKKFHGQKTSIGEPYDMFSMTAAHPTLAIPSYVRVTSVGNGKSVVVRVTDRGPFHADRVIDLSAQMLTGQKVTPLSAWRSLGIYRLSDTVLQLRKLGWSIETGYETRPNKFGEGYRFAAYRLNNESIESSGMEGVAFTEREIAAMRKRMAS